MSSSTHARTQLTAHTCLFRSFFSAASIKKTAPTCSRSGWWSSRCSPGSSTSSPPPVRGPPPRLPHGPRVRQYSAGFRPIRSRHFGSPGELSTNQEPAFQGILRELSTNQQPAFRIFSSKSPEETIVSTDQEPASSLLLLFFRKGS